MMPNDGGKAAGPSGPDALNGLLCHRLELGDMVKDMRLKLLDFKQQQVERGKPKISFLSVLGAFACIGAGEALNLLGGDAGREPFYPGTHHEQLEVVTVAFCENLNGVTALE